MAIETVREILGWCTVINVGLLLFSFVFMCAGRRWVWQMHGKWFAMPEGQFNAIIYGGLGLYKVLIIVFNLVPYIAVCIATR